MGIAPIRARGAGAVFAVLAVNCGSGADPYSLPVGVDEGGGGSFGDDASAPGSLDAEIQENRVTVDFVTVSCTGVCPTVTVVATGGNAPYSFAWSDGSTLQTREVCPGRTTDYSVTVTDTAASGEVPRPAEHVQRPLTASVLACADGGPALGDLLGQHTVTVPATADVWLAGQPTGSMLLDNMGGGDTVPAQSPVEVPVGGARTVTVSASGGVSYIGGGLCAGTSPDGGCTVLLVSQGPDNGLSSLAVPMNALIGVFLDATTPGGQPPAPLDASGANDFATLAPLLRQVFFIGDGLTGTGSGAVQQFTVPSGATRLALGSSDTAGGNYNNSGQFNLTVSEF